MNASARLRAFAAVIIVIASVVVGPMGCSDKLVPVNRSLDTTALCLNRDVNAETGCRDGERFVKGECAPARCDAGDLPNNCCPGMFCDAGGSCQIPGSRVVKCSADSECQNGMRCLDRPLISADKTCGFAPPDEGGKCPVSLSLFNSRCVSTAPCNNGCPQGQVCNIDTNRCETAPTLANAGNGCDATCADGTILVYADPNSMLWDRCCEVSCRCEAIPGLSPGPWGSYSDMVVDSTHINISAYDPLYGDLVFAVLDRASNSDVAIDYIDGVPSNAPVVANPTGIRGGMSDPGPDVGRYTSLAMFEDAARIVYYSAQTQDLKFAAFDKSSQSWTTSVVDSGAGNGDVGRYTSLVLDAQGRPHVSYLAHRVTENGTILTTPMYARATSATPRGPEDWQRVAVESTAACNQDCAAGETCVATESGPACLAKASNCATDCACDQACVADQGNSMCHLTLPEFLDQACGGSCPSGFSCVAGRDNSALCAPASNDCSVACDSDETCVASATGAICERYLGSATGGSLPPSNGLYSSLVLHNNTPTLVYYDRLRHQLRGAVANFATDAESITAGFASMPVACSASIDFGQHAALAVSPDGNLGVAYQGHNGEDLWYFSGSDFMTGSAELVDDGMRESQMCLVGAYASLGFRSDGMPVIAYQDQTNNDLLLAYRAVDGWRHTRQADDGAYGSYSKLVIDGDMGYLGNYARRQSAAGRDISRYEVQMVDLNGIAP